MEELKQELQVLKEEQKISQQQILNQQIELEKQKLDFENRLQTLENQERKEVLKRVPKTHRLIHHLVNENLKQKEEHNEELKNEREKLKKVKDENSALKLKIRILSQSVSKPKPQISNQNHIKLIQEKNFNNQVFGQNYNNHFQNNNQESNHIYRNLSCGIPSVDYEREQVGEC